MVARDTPDALATSSIVVFAIPKREMHAYAPERTRTRASFTRSTSVRGLRRAGHLVVLGRLRREVGLEDLQTDRLRSVDREHRGGPRRVALGGVAVLVVA